MRPASPTSPQSRLQLLAALQLSPSSSLWPLHANASQTCVTTSLSLPHPAPRSHTQPAQSALHLPQPTSPLPAALVQRPPHRLQVLRPLQTPLHSALVSRQVPAAVSHLQRLLIIDCFLCRRQVRALSSIKEFTIQARKPSHSFCIFPCSAMTLAEQRTGFSHTTQQPVFLLSIGNFSWQCKSAHLYHDTPASCDLKE